MHHNNYSVLPTHYTTYLSLAHSCRPLATPVSLKESMSRSGRIREMLLSDFPLQRSNATRQKRTQITWVASQALQQIVRIPLQYFCRLLTPRLRDELHVCHPSKFIDSKAMSNTTGASHIPNHTHTSHFGQQALQALQAIPAQPSHTHRTR